MPGGLDGRQEKNGLTGAIFLSLFLHAALLALLLLSPSFPSHGISLGPVYDVALVDFPDGRASGGYATGAPSSAGKEAKAIKRVETSSKISLPPLPEVPVRRIERRVEPPKVAKEVKEAKEAKEDRSALERAIANAKKKAAAESSSPGRPFDDAKSVGKAQKADGSAHANSSPAGTAAQAGRAASGVSSAGEGGEGAGDARVNAYYREIWLRIRAQWALPGGMLPREPLESVISIVILRTGAIVEAKFEKTSGNRYFDESAMKAVQKANPLPPMPAWLNGNSLNVGIRFHSSEFVSP